MQNPIFGVNLAMLIISLAGASMLSSCMSHSTERPNRPVYDNDLPEDRPATSELEPALEEDSDLPARPVYDNDLPDELLPAREPELNPDGSYSVIVTQPVGLILRSGPGTDYDNIGGIGYQESLLVLGEEDGWLNVQLSNGDEGWIKDRGTSPL